MPSLMPAPRPAFVPIFWVLPQTGTNGHISTWGAKLCGTQPPGAEA